MTYAELVQKIRDYCEVDSNVFTSTIVDGFLSDTCKPLTCEEEPDCPIDKRLKDENDCSTCECFECPALDCSVTAAIIADDVFPVAVSLVENALYGLTDILLGIIDRCYDAYQRLSHCLHRGL